VQLLHSTDVPGQELMATLDAPAVLCYFLRLIFLLGMTVGASFGFAIGGAMRLAKEADKAMDAEQVHQNYRYTKSERQKSKKSASI
jgi:hypothetical protein